MPPKEIPQMGPGSKISALIEAVKKNLIITEVKTKRELLIDFSSCGFTVLPVELCKNEEVIELAVKFLLPFNRLKQLPGNIDALVNLRHIDMKCNVMTSIPGSVFNLQQLEFLDCSHNAIKAIPGTIKSCLFLHTFICEDNKLKTLPTTINKCSALKLVNAKFNEVSPDVCRCQGRVICECK
ncbi:leucine-rich repeat protein soc-2 [Biomphalaria glabrata]|nr:leucine-rich repeat protein soc-2 [Biomphalaria glabrata]